MQWTNNTANFAKYSPVENLSNSDPTALNNCGFDSTIPAGEQPLVINGETDDPSSYILNLNGRCPQTAGSVRRTRMELTPNTGGGVYTLQDLEGFTFTGLFKMKFNANMIPASTTPPSPEETPAWPEFNSYAVSKSNNHASITFFQIFGGSGSTVIEFGVGYWGSGQSTSGIDWPQQNVGPAIGTYITNPGGSSNKYNVIVEDSDLVNGDTQFGLTIEFKATSIYYTITIPGKPDTTGTYSWTDLGVSSSTIVYLKQGAYCQVNHTGQNIEPPSGSTWSDTKICSLTVLESKLSDTPS